MRADDPYTDLLSHARRIRLLESVSDVLAWDQEVVMPEGGTEWRAAELEELARLTHVRVLDPSFAERIERATELLAGSQDSPQAAVVREIRRRRDREVRMPESLVGEIAAVQSLAQRAWAEAREKSDFATFAPWLERLVGLMRRKAECLRDDTHGEPWDALADEHEPGMRAGTLRPMFDELRPRLVRLVQRLLDEGTPPDDSARRTPVPVDRQESLVRDVILALGFDGRRGRIDRSVHPFCSGTHPGDVRITTRYLRDDFFDGLGSAMHEAGHALYEQGFDPAHAGTPLAQATSLGIHESQSRLWENRVGRSHGFWHWCTPRVHAALGDVFHGSSSDELFAAANRVERSLIRVEADEATYDLHVLARFTIETELIAGELAIAQVPDRWNAAYRELLGIDVPDDRRGCLQDVHWSCGLFGYFPTYTLGNLYSAQLFAAAERDLGHLDEAFSRGEFAPLLQWLRENVHRHGARYPAAELCERVTGATLSPDPFVAALERRLFPLYGL